MDNKNAEKQRVGWKEWVALPELGIVSIKAKVDTGARTSALHTYRIETFCKDNKDYVRFWIHPLQKNQESSICCEAVVHDKRIVKDSGGHSEDRYVIKTNLLIAEQTYPIELTLTNREDMLFRMLLGRAALTSGNMIVDPDAAYLTGKQHKKKYKKLTQV